MGSKWLGKTVRNCVVLVSTYKRDTNGILEKCLRLYLKNNGYGDQFPVLICDDGSRSSARETYSSIREICERVGLSDYFLSVRSRNEGVGSTRHRLIEMSKNFANRHDLLFCLDDDAYLQKNAIKNMIKALDREPSCGIMGVMGPFRNFYYMEKKPFEMPVVGVAYGIRAVLPFRDGVSFRAKMRARADAMLDIEACLAGWKVMVNPSSDASHVRSIKNESGKGHGGGGLASAVPSQKRWLKFGELIVKEYPKFASMDKRNRLHYLRRIKAARENGQIVLQDAREI